jgi:glycine/sarcosine N-methyltransferase
MGFYEDFAAGYDRLFPADPETIDFLKRELGPPPARVVDLACGSGGYALALAEAGFEVTGIDLSEAMIAAARAKAGNRPGLRFLAADMSRVEPDGLYRGWYCIGNSLVHLGGPEEIAAALNVWKRLQEPGGSWVIQIVNYDRILDRKITALPTLRDGDAELVRNYEIVSERLVRFKTRLTWGGQRFENETPLYPLRRAEALRLLEGAGLKATAEYGEFDRSPWSPESFAYVAVGTR